MWFIIILFVIYAVAMLPHVFETYTNMEYIRHLEDMGVFVDEHEGEI